ncbi:ammonium transporter [Actinomycetospora sp. NBRC 106375]|uniref:ammonium transporter n=1 Tax=Actinomycetospora sp. NBRC 106375 TaxID=3032207 RepID=UPI002556691B|nr:ammonium transporter [Actinomycetospora sp. NBRC 106375]
MLMTPGLAFFYGGMVRSRSVLNMLMMNFMCLAIVGVLWCLYGFSLAFGNDSFGGLIGNFQYLGLGNFPTDPTGADPDYIPLYAFAMFQLMFAVITPALISGAIPDRVKFWSWSVFVALWATIVYFPVAHWVFDFDGGNSAETGGWIANQLGALDFAGGTAVHINAGAAGLALALVIGKRRGWPRDPGRPHSIPFVLLGASLLWFGWFGFNAGSALGANDVAGIAFTNTMLATCAATIGWLIVEQARDGKPTTLGAASGAVAGLVAITPACAYVNPVGALAVGVIAGAVCALCVSIKFRLGFDDSLDVVAVHLVGGLVGTLLIGFFGTTSLNSSSADGLFYGGGFSQLGIQAIAAFSVMIYSFVVTAILALIIKATMGFRVTDEDESSGIDESQHAESGYDYSGLRIGGASSSVFESSAAGDRVAATPREGSAP